MTTQPDNDGARPRNVGAMILLVASYPLFAHLAVLSGRPGLIAASISLLVVLILFPPLRSGRPLAWCLLLAAGLGLYEVARAGQTLLLLFLPPILLNGFMAWIFGRTLQAGRTSLIERAIVVMNGPTAVVTSDMAAYARSLTWTWTALFVSLAGINFVLAALASPGGMLLAAGLDPGITVPLSVWSLFANVLNYLVVGALFAIEYQVRLRRFPQQSFGGFFRFIRRLIGMGEMFRPSAGLAGPSGAGARKP